MAPLTVTQLDHQKIELQSKAEVDLYNRAQAKYISENSFTVASDERALDRLILQEVLMYRWQSQLASGLDYSKTPLTQPEQESLRKNIKEGAITIAQIHKDLGLDKVTREKDSVESVGAYIENLQKRAKEFGIHREKQLDSALTLINELFAHVGAFSRSNEYERKRLGFPDEASLVKWIIEDMQPRFKAIDDHFRTNAQKYWRDTL